MKKRLMTFAALVLIAQLAISQNDYPKKVIINNDTLCLITIPQIRLVNESFIQLDCEKEKNDSIRSLASLYKKRADLSDQTLFSQNKQLNLKDSVIFRQEMITSILKAENANQSKLIKRLKNASLSLSIAIGILGLGLLIK